MQSLTNNYVTYDTILECHYIAEECRKGPHYVYRVIVQMSQNRPNLGVSCGEIGFINREEWGKGAHYLEMLSLLHN